VAEAAARYDRMSPEQLIREVTKLEKRMLKAARDLEFEEAARLRDEIASIRQQGLGLPKSRAG
jgi:excinuclease ABC subunit B